MRSSSGFKPLLWCSRFNSQAPITTPCIFTIFQYNSTAETSLFSPNRFWPLQLPKHYCSSTLEKGLPCTTLHFQALSALPSAANSWYMPSPGSFPFPLTFLLFFRGTGRMWIALAPSCCSKPSLSLKHHHHSPKTGTPILSGTWGIQINCPSSRKGAKKGSRSFLSPPPSHPLSMFHTKHPHTFQTNGKK